MERPDIFTNGVSPSWDGKGAASSSPHPISAAGRSEARQVGLSIANSPLFKTACFGSDPNWGRIICAAGYSGIPIDENHITISINGATLFETGKAVYSHPVRIIFKEEKGEVNIPLMAVSVPKRLFKKAVDRNLLKRRIGEAYRLNKGLLLDVLQERDSTLQLVIQYQHKEIEKYQVIEEGLVKGLSKLKASLKQKR